MELIFELLAQMANGCVDGCDPAVCDSALSSAIEGFEAASAELPDSPINFFEYAIFH
ncbi:MAG: hypothetical protein MJZ01_07975 [Bacteroidales bacterium]|nr:hypothetical protein [Bacteroidales bacterium]